MLETVNVGLQYGGRVLFEHVDLKFTSGNCYGLIGANGAGKSTFMKILAGAIEPNKGEVRRDPNERMSVLRQDHFAFDDYDVMRTVLLGNPRLCEIIDEKDVLYSKEEMTEEEGMRLCELEEEFSEMDGWSAESGAEILLNGLGVPNELHYAPMAELTGENKVKVLLAQALFGNPDILLMDEPTSALDTVTQKQTVEEMLALREIYDTAIILVTHNIGVVEAMADKVLVLHEGRQEEYGPAAQVLRCPQAEYTKELLAAVPRLRRKGSGKHDETDTGSKKSDRSRSGERGYHNCK